MAEQSQIPEEQLDVIFHHGAYPLWVYLQDVQGINIVDVCARVTKEDPILTTEFGQLASRVITLPHANELDHTYNNDVIFLLNSINVVFESLKVGIERDGTKLLQAFKFTLDSDKNMFLIGVDTGIPVSNKALSIVKI